MAAFAATAGGLLITFQISRHTGKNREVVEVYNDGRFVATLYQADDNENALRLISTHTSRVSMAHTGESSRVRGLLELDFLMDT